MNKPPEQLLRAKLGAGAAEVISLATDLKATKVLIDGRRGRRTAKLIYDLNMIVTIGLLLRAKQNNIIQSVKPSKQRIISR